ncbi:MAG: GIY-YIG nuclease family protein [Planctomycetota bacterium]|jgi:sugar fermentation stimulation protein A
MRAFSPDAEDLPEGGGVYALLLRLRGRPTRVRVGALGWVRLEPGYYCYVGSARNGLKARVSRHFRHAAKKRHWHVDYLRERSEPVRAHVWTGEGADECVLSEALRRLADDSVRGFGSSDCRCPSHLHYFRKDPVGLLRGLRLPG